MSISTIETRTNDFGLRLNANMSFSEPKYWRTICNGVVKRSNWRSIKKRTGRLDSNTYLDVHTCAIARLSSSSLVRQRCFHAQFVNLAHLVAENTCPLVQFVCPLAQIMIVHIDPVAVFIEQIALQIELVALFVQSVALHVQLIALNCQLVALHIQLVGLSAQLNALEGQSVSLKIQYTAKLRHR